MPKVEIYTWKSCPFCIRAKRLLDKKNINYIEYGIDGDETARDQMIARGSDGKRSVPQIFISDRHIGGCDAIHDLDAQGKLDALLSA
jgi:glutaredoxin 3